MWKIKSIMTNTHSQKYFRWPQSTRTRKLDRFRFCKFLLILSHDIDNTKQYKIYWISDVVLSYHTIIFLLFEDHTIKKFAVFIKVCFIVNCGFLYFLYVLNAFGRTI